jgi:hypothetical protein
MFPRGGASFLHRIPRARGRDIRAAAPLASVPNTSENSDRISTSFSAGILVRPIGRVSRTPWLEVVIQKLSRRRLWTKKHGVCGLYSARPAFGAVVVRKSRLSPRTLSLLRSTRVARSRLEDVVASPLCGHLLYVAPMTGMMSCVRPGDFAQAGNRFLTCLPQA